MSDEFLKGLPKCEAHCHIEGTLMPDLLLELSKKNNIALPVDWTLAYLEQRHLGFKDLQDFLNAYYTSMNVLLDESDYERLGMEYYLHSKADGVVHSDIFVDPQAHLSRGISLDTVLAGLTKARLRANTELGISGRIITCFMRDRPVAEALPVLDQIAQGGWIERGDVIGIGLDSAELPFPPTLFVELYNKAKSLGLKLTAHAGEEGPPSYVVDSLDQLGVSRIDHGIRSAEDPKLMARLAKAKIPLTVCPLSNVALRCVKTVDELPLRQFIQQDIVWSINGDDPAYFGGYLLDNYKAVQHAFTFDVLTWRIIALNGIEGSWATEERKTQIRKVIEDYCAR